MSHVVSSPVIITDLEALKQALAKIKGCHWRQGQKNYKWYGRWMQDYNSDDAAFKLGIDPKNYGKCDHAISVDGSGYEIGVVKRIDGKGYALVWDFYGTGRKINQVIGDGGEKLLCEYQRCYLQNYAKNEGLTFTMEESGNEVVIEMGQSTQW